MDISFERTLDGKDEWLTPPEIIRSLGLFDLDPCAPINRPWDTAAQHFTVLDDGLKKSWGESRIWCNPPYGGHTGKWLARMAEHNNGICLIFARTETVNFQKYVFPFASAMLFLKGRITFYNVDGTKPNNSAGAPSVLVAYGKNNADSLKICALEGFFIQLNSQACAKHSLSID